MKYAKLVSIVEHNEELLAATDDGSIYAWKYSPIHKKDTWVLTREAVPETLIEGEAAFCTRCLDHEGSAQATKDALRNCACIEVEAVKRRYLRLLTEALDDANANTEVECLEVVNRVNHDFFPWQEDGTMSEE